MQVLSQLPEQQVRTTFSKSELKCYEISKFGRTFKGSDEIETRTAIGHLLTERIFEMIGLKDVNFPTADGAKDISYFIYNRYPDFTLQDIYNAFEYALAEITSAPGNNNEDWLNHYQSFNIKYFAPILNSYRKFKSNAITKVEKKLLQRVELNEFIELRKMNSESIKDNILMMYQRYLDQEFYKIFTTDNIYCYLDELRLIESSNEQKNEYLKTAKLIITQRKNDEKSRSIKLEDWIQSKKRSIYSLARHKCVLQLFEELSSFGLQVDNFGIVLSNACFIDYQSHEQLKSIQENGTF